MTTDNKKQSKSNIKCCESGCLDCPYDFQAKSKVDPNIPREFQTKKVSDDELAEYYLSLENDQSDSDDQQ